MYHGCFEISYIFSPPRDVVQAWTQVKEYVDKLNVIKDKTPFSSYSPDELEPNYK